MRITKRKMWPSLVFATMPFEMPFPGQDMIDDTRQLFELTGHPTEDTAIAGFGFYGWPVSKTGSHLVGEKIKQMRNIGVYLIDDPGHISAATVATDTEIDTLPPNVGEALEILSERAFLENPHWSHLRVRDLYWRAANMDPTNMNPVEFRDN